MRRIKVKGSIPSLNTLTRQSLCIPAIDLVLMRDKGTEDRGHGWNSPSGIGGCMRASYYTRTGVIKTNANDDPRAIRILNNGTFVHERLQSYLKKSGIVIIYLPDIVEKYGTKIPRSVLPTILQKNLQKPNVFAIETTWEKISKDFFNLEKLINVAYAYAKISEYEIDEEYKKENSHNMNI